MSEGLIRTSPDAISPDWLTGALHRSGALDKGAAINSAAFEAVGTGQVCDSYRFTLDYSVPGAGPTSVIVKLPSADEGTRAAGQSLGLYNSEVNFYNTFAAKLPLRTPVCHFAKISESQTDFTLVMEDVSPARQGDQMQGCSLDQARLAVREITKLHAPYMNDTGLKKMPWLGRDQNEDALDFTPLLPGFFKDFLARYDGQIEPDIAAMGERYFGKVGELAAPVDDPFCLVHVDYRPDNILFASDAGGPPITVVDWQTAACGSPLVDVAYFIGAGLPVKARRLHEEDLVRLYHDTMLEAGVDVLPWDKCWQLYRLNAFGGLVVAVLSAMLVERTPRGDEMFLTMARRHGQQILDHDGEALLVYG